MDDEGTIHVVEAVLAGVIILTAVLFLTSTSAPSPSAAQSGIDLERTSADTLKILHTRPAEDSCDQDTDDATPGIQPPEPCYTSRLEEIVSHAMGYGVASPADQTAKQDDATSFLRQVIPVGNRFLLRLDNGEEPLDLLPTGSGVAVTPRAAKAAETFLVPQWQAFNGTVDAAGDPACDSATNLPNAPDYIPGGPEDPDGATGALPALDVQAGDTLEAPTGSAVAPDGGDWATWWIDQQGSQTGNIPLTVLYGWWIHDTDGDGSRDLPAECFFVGGVDGAVTDFPVYGVQLVVWPIAG